jgi:hypothetical protein
MRLAANALDRAAERVGETSERGALGLLPERLTPQSGEQGAHAFGSRAFVCQATAMQPDEHDRDCDQRQLDHDG